MDSTGTALKGLTRLAANSGAPDQICDDFLSREFEERKPPDVAESRTPPRQQFFPCWPCHVEPLEQTILFVSGMYVVQRVVFIAGPAAYAATLLWRPRHANSTTVR
jgi:hypothetical protein